MSRLSRPRSPRLAGIVGATCLAVLVLGEPATATIYGSYDVRGAIEIEYLAVYGQATLGLPTTDETATPDGIGRYNHFSRGASIYWTPRTGAHEVHGAIRATWAGLGWESGPLGYPTQDEAPARPTTGRYSSFENGAVFWSNSTGAVPVLGEISRRYWQIRSYVSPLGWPVSSESAIAGGRVQRFQNGSMYWTPGWSAAEVYGLIGQRYASLGATAGVLGFPRSGEYPFNEGRGQDFQGGSIFWSPGTGAHELHGAIRSAWRTYQGGYGLLGLPTTGEYTDAGTVGGRAQDFQYGHASWTPTGGVSITSWLPGAQLR